ncbi:MAG TPA: 50S ribosomal protein L10 [Patescibacteria group bacterium]|nr:50S ribosomal protein L10 [Patescibacteria group bacterium]
MKLTRSQKEEQVKEMTKSLEESKAVILVNFQGLKVKEIQDLKKKLKEKKINFRIVKNSLLKIALKNSKLLLAEELLDQPIAMVWGATDEVEPAKLTVEFGKTAESLQIVGGIVNRQFAEKNIISELAALPSREILFARLVGSINAPLSRLVNALQGNLRSLVYILKQYKEQKA